MDASRTPRYSVRLAVEISRTRDGRLEGHLRTHATEPWTPFSGVLELLKVLEESLDAAETVTPVQPKEGTQP
jgi:hypothetical protein